MSEAITAVNLTKHYGRLKALDNVSLTVARGELLAVLGPSGCGKSTLLKVLAGLTPASGEVWLGGERVDAVPTRLRGIGFVFQSYALFEQMTVADNILFGLRVRRATREERQKRLTELLEVTGLGGQEQKLPRQLSGGQQQRVALARALAPHPGVILLDEPLSALDVQVRRSLRRELKNIQQTLGVTMMLVTHDQEEAFVLGDRVAVMNLGRVEQTGTPRDLYHLPENEFVAGFVGENNVLTGVVAGGDILVGGHVFSTAPRGQNPGLVRLYIRPEDLVLKRERRHEPSPGLRAVVAGIDFGGPAYYYRLKPESGPELKALLPRADASVLNLIPGDTVRVTGRPNLIVPLGAGQAEKAAGIPA